MTAHSYDCRTDRLPVPQAGAVEPAELAMFAALLTSNSNVAMVEYLMAGMWILLKQPENRKVRSS